MKKIFLLLTAVLWVTITYAQQPPQKTVIVDYFNRASGVNSKYRDMARANILTALTNSKRCKVIDATNETALAMKEESTATGAIPTLDNIRRDAMVQAGGNLLVSGSITNVGADRERDSDGKIYYNGIVNVTLNLIDLSTGNSIAARDFKYSGIIAESGSTPDQAIAATIGNVSGSMRVLINDVFKVNTRIIQIEEVKKGRARLVYVNAGSSTGFTKGQMFTVYQVKDVAGHSTRSQVGQLVAEEVQGADITLCKVLGGKEFGELVIQASNDPERVVLEVVSAQQRMSFFGL